MHPYMKGPGTWKHNQYFNPDSGVSIYEKYKFKVNNFFLYNHVSMHLLNI